MDGGISDNLGVRTILREVIVRGDNISKLLDAHDSDNIKNVVFITVDSSNDIPPQIAKTAEEPKITDMISAVTTIQSRRYNTETLSQLKTKMNKWQAQMQYEQCNKRATQPCKGPNFYLIELNLKQLPKTLPDDPALYPTTLELPEEQVDTLIYAGKYLLEHNKEFNRLNKALTK